MDGRACRGCLRGRWSGHADERQQEQSDDFKAAPSCVPHCEREYTARADWGLGLGLGTRVGTGVRAAGPRIGTAEFGVRVRAPNRRHISFTDRSDTIIVFYFYVTGTRFSHSMPPEQLTAQGLYDPMHEHDACGVGFVVDIKGRKSHDIVQEGAAGPEEPPAPRRVRLRGEYRRWRRHPRADARRVSALRRAGGAAASRTVRRRPRVPAERCETSRGARATDRAHRGRRGTDPPRLARRPDRQLADRPQRRRGRADVPAVVRGGLCGSALSVLCSRLVRAQAVRHQEAYRARGRCARAGATSASSSTSSACRRTR